MHTVQFINGLFQHLPLTEHAPEYVEWAQSLNDEVLATALLDRLLYRCELIQLSGESYRMVHRKSIFEKKTSNELTKSVKK